MKTDMHFEGGLFMTQDLVVLPLLIVKSNLKYAGLTTANVDTFPRSCFSDWGKSDQISVKINS